MPKQRRRIPGKRLIFRPYITLPNGTVLWAKHRGIRAFPIWVDEDDT
jgi:hypothetical protein